MQPSKNSELIRKANYPIRKKQTTHSHVYYPVTFKIKSKRYNFHKEVSMAAPGRDAGTEPFQEMKFKLSLYNYQMQGMNIIQNRQ